VAAPFFMRVKSLVRLRINLSDIVGVHIGVDEKGNNHCLRLSGKAEEIVKKVLKVYSTPES
jgi:hypothetical protein